MQKSRQHVQFLIKKLEIFKISLPLAIAVVFLVIGIMSMRQNNLNAIVLRDKVLLVDQQNGDVEAALRELRQYTYSHMNSNLAGGTVQQPVQLKYRYERLVQAEKARVSAANAQIYNQAQKSCEAQLPAAMSGRTRVPCIEAYVTSHSVKEQPIPDALYKFDFAAPAWSPDLAGISLLISAVAAIIFVVGLVLNRWLRNFVRQHL